MESACQRKRYSSSFFASRSSYLQRFAAPILKILGGFTVKANLIPSHFGSRLLQLCAAPILLAASSASRPPFTLKTPDTSLEP